MEISLVSSPMPQSNNWIFFSPPENTGDTQIFLTQIVTKSKSALKTSGRALFIFRSRTSLLILPRTTWFIVAASERPGFSVLVRLISPITGACHTAATALTVTESQNSDVL